MAESITVGQTKTYYWDTSWPYNNRTFRFWVTVKLTGQKTADNTSNLTIKAFLSANFSGDLAWNSGPTIKLWCKQNSSAWGDAIATKTFNNYTPQGHYDNIDYAEQVLSKDVTISHLSDGKGSFEVCLTNTPSGNTTYNPYALEKYTGTINLPDIPRNHHVYAYDGSSWKEGTLYGFDGTTWRKGNISTGGVWALDGTTWRKGSKRGA